MKYQVRVDDRLIEIDLNGPRPLVNGREVRAELTTVPGTLLRHLVVDRASHAFTARQGDEKGVWFLGMGGRPLTVEALDERTRAIREMAGTSEAPAAKMIVAPMPGLVVRIHVRPGDVVATGQGVIVVEAMKMENELKAPADGTVAKIVVEPGQPVEKGAVLVVFE